MFQGFQLLNKRLGYIDFTNAVEVALYILSLLLVLDFQEYSLQSIAQLTNDTLTLNDVGFFFQLQGDSGLRLVS